MFQGSDTETEYDNFLEPAFFSNAPVYYLQPQCSSDSKFSVSFPFGSGLVQQGSGFLQIINYRVFLSFFDMVSDLTCRSIKGFKIFLCI